MRPVCFLFSAPELIERYGSPYHWPAQRLIVPVLLGREGQSPVETRCADLLTEFLAMRVVTVRSHAPRSKRVRPGAATVQQVDGELLMTLVWDFCDAIGEQGSTVDLDRAPRLLNRGEVLAFAASDADDATFSAVNDAARAEPAYLGGFWLDMGNPVQARLISALSGQGHLVNRDLVLDRYTSDDPLGSAPPPEDDWWTGLPFEAVRYATDAEHEGFPPWPVAEPSKRGMQSAAILAARNQVTHIDRLGQALVSSDDIGAAPFEVSRAAMPRASDAIVEEQKLRGYVLNAEHETGRHKAKLFRDLLAIKADDWEFLAAQLKHGVAAATELLRVRTDQHGVRYHVVVDVLGRNGAKKPVQAAWEVKSQRPPRLVTAYIASPEAVASAFGGEAAVVSPDLEGEERWQAIWASAERTAEEARAACVPTPMMVNGEWVPTGRFGFSFVRVRPASDGFGKWLLEAGRARRVGKVAVVSAPGDLYDPAVEYATALAEVLRLNGVDCYVESRLD